ncbi:DNA mismatch repair endonuclease MutL [uncultured Granulicatella sp.]|uniref:DNA mismatch repair endonuclease MutL n=1 Tax=uncultured Granulicatella sp. TaxID=316089 RepID=UPI0028D1E056|nr:DNA mismatch repair endonuclease MutL [uncultured Granulicatella sp.]
MGKIKELSALLTNQIAAGEVIERPSSVVKELLENAVDAGSTRIVIDIEEAGLKLIRITDNGSGMSREDAVLSIRRHTTSKIYSPEQLFRIKTLGFRGEALASITAVSKVTVTTSTGEKVGTQLKVESGTIVEETQVPPLKGTTIEVSDLFYNTPARLKFVRTLQTEIAHITDVVSKISLSHPEISIILRNEENELIRTAGNGDLRQAIAGNLGPTNARKMLAFSGEDDDFKVSGYTSLPELTRSNRNYISIFINGRSIRNIAISKAIVAGYGSTLMVGRFPITVIDIEMDFQLVDVNVHPTKQEVRISKEVELSALIQKALHEAIQGVQRIPESLEDLPFKRKSTESTTARPVVEQETLNFDLKPVQPSIRVETTSEWIKEEEPSLYTSSEELPFETEESPSEGETSEELTEEIPVQITVHNKEGCEDCRIDFHQEKANYWKLSQVLDEENFETDFPELHYFGQMHGTYLFAQNEKGLYMIDQHAAQERIKYEIFKVSIGEVAPVSQSLMIPIVMEFSKKEALKLQESLEMIQEFGIEIEPFGTHTFQIQSHPSWIKQGEEKEIIEEIIDLVLSNQKVTVAQLRKATAIMMSCKGSIKANHRLTTIEAEQLLVDLAKCKNPYNCPHGRPVLVHLSNKDLEKLFKRIQDPHQSKWKFED